MKNFDIRRFCAVARWDLTINRAFYNKMAMVIAACSILPVLFYYAIENLEMVMDSDGVDKPYPSFQKQMNSFLHNIFDNMVLVADNYLGIIYQCFDNCSSLCCACIIFHI